MNRVDRLMGIVVRLQSRRVVRAEDLATHFEISLRTVYRDMVALGEAGIPVISEAGVGYSLVKGYHLPPVMLTADEASALFMGSKLVEHLTDPSLQKQMDSALAKIRSVLPRERQDQLDRLERYTEVVPCNSPAPPRLSSGALIPIQRAVAERRVLAMEYHGAQRAELTIRKVEPLGLAYYNNNWHLIGYCRLRQDVRDFRTDRICALEVQDELFSGHAEFSLKRYLEAASRAGKFEAVKVLFQPEVMKRVRCEWSSRLAEERTEKEGIVGTLLAYSMEGVAEWVLSFGGKAEVIAPEHLRHLVAAEAGAVANRYGMLFESTSTRPRTRQSTPKLSSVAATQ